jgi:hypothetical protein
MKKIILTALALSALLAVQSARAWSYSDGDLLLVFRASGHNDIEYDLGSVSNLLGHATGYTTTITGWDPSLATGTFGSDLTGVNVILLAVTSSAKATPTAWLSSTDPNTTAYRVNLSTWTSSLHNIISPIGNKPISPFNVPPAAATPTNAYSIDPGGQYGGASYDTIASGGTITGAKNIAFLGGNVPFTVQQTIPGSFDFWAIQPTTVFPSPDALIGTFSITTNGVLTFVAGPRTPAINTVAHSVNVSTIQFSTTIGNTYSVAYTNALGGATATWPVDSTTLIGNGKINSINHTNTGSGDEEFYRVIAQ